MKYFIVFGVLCVQLNWVCGVPIGVSSFAYQDSSGKRYGGTYQIPDDQFDQFYGPRDLPFQIPFEPSYYPEQDHFFPDYFKNLQYLIQDIISTYDSRVGGENTASFETLTNGFGIPPLPPLRPFFPFKPLPPLKPLFPLRPLPPLQPSTPFEPLPPLQTITPFRPFTPKRLLNWAFQSNLANQNLALRAAQKAFDLTSNQVYNQGYIPYFPSRSGDFGNFGMSNSANSAFAGAAAGPGFTHQIAAISPSNPNQPNINKFERFNEASSRPGNNFVSMSSRAFSSSSNINGKEFSNRGSETIVNNNGKITEYSVSS